MSVYKIVTERIRELLSQGEIPWQKPWKGGAFPKNLDSKKPYNGINLFLLNASKYSSEYWLTWNQIKKRDGSVKPGEKATKVVFWKLNKHTETQEDGDTKTDFVPIFRYYNVFNLDQTTGIKAPEPKTPTQEIKPIETCETIVENYKDKPEIRTGESQAYYKPSQDYVNLPNKDLFNSSEEYYSTLFHELTHSTGHKDRLNRTGIEDAVTFGTTNYSKEELVAEFGAAFLCGHAGIENKTVINSAAYIQGWLKRLEDDPKLVVQAAAQAQKATKYILGDKESEATQ